MGRKIIIAAATVLSIGLLLRLFSTPGRAQDVDQANAALAKTEHRLADEVTKSTGTATALEQDFSTPDKLPGELTEFVTTTDRLRQLSEDLGKDITAYETATTNKLAEFDGELKAIKDTSTRRHMERLRVKAQRQAAERVQISRSALDGLQLVLAQGGDLQHAAKCVQLADELHVQGTDLESQVRTARDQAAAYARLSNTLLAKLTTPAENTN
jgi:septal ring factor EnvC (AmiA/AmiB activator)